MGTEAVGPTPEQKVQWEEEGYIVLENALHGAQLQRLQAAFDKATVECKEDWLQRVARGEAQPTFFDIPDPLERDEIFVDIVDHPSWFGLLQDFTGGETLFLGPQVRSVPVWPVSYTGWHPDVPLSNPLHIKVQIYVEDVSENSGEFAFKYRDRTGQVAVPTHAPSWVRACPAIAACPAERERPLYLTHTVGIRLWTMGRLRRAGRSF